MKKKDISKKQLKEFGIFMGFGLPVFFGFIIPLLWGHELRFWTIWVGLVFLLAAFFRPNNLFVIYRLWMRIGEFLGWINSRIILGLIFILVLQPIALVMRILGYDPLDIRKNKVSTYKKAILNKKIDLKRIF